LPSEAILPIRGNPYIFLSIETMVLAGITASANCGMQSQLEDLVGCSSDLCYHRNGDLSA
jgi:hypothetical protein